MPGFCHNDALSDFRPHGDKFLRGGWMDTDGHIELRLGRTAVKRHGQALNDLSGIGSHHVAAQNLIRGLVNNQLHHGPLIASGKSMFKRLESGSIDIDPMAAPARLLFGQTDGATVGRAEHRRRDI